MLMVHCLDCLDPLEPLFKSGYQTETDGWPSLGDRMNATLFILLDFSVAFNGQAMQVVQGQGYENAWHCIHCYFSS